jgi:alkaline phosphatase D
VAAVLSNPQLVVDGTWDDHDFGVDNADAHTFDARTKDAHKAEILDFLDASPDDPRREASRGLYSSRLVGPHGEVDVVLLDTRYARTANELLGEAQWAWLNDHLARSTATATLVVSSVQVLADGRSSLHEGWWAYPTERQRLVQAMVNHGVKAPLLISGDVHFAELSAHTCSSLSPSGVSGAGAESVTLAEMTSSGMTHAWGHAAAGAHHDWWPMHYTKHWLMVACQHVLGATAWTYQYSGAFFLDLNLGEVSSNSFSFFFLERKKCR